MNKLYKIELEDEKWDMILSELDQAIKNSERQSKEIGYSKVSEFWKRISSDYKQTRNELLKQLEKQGFTYRYKENMEHLT